MKTSRVWPVFVDALRALGKQYYPAMDSVMTKAGLDGGIGGLLLTLFTFDPVPVSNEILQKRMPYQQYSERLENAVELGLLKAVGEGEFRLAEKGRTLVVDAISAAYNCMQQLDPMGPNDLHCLSVLLHRLVKACYASPDPPGKWSITHSRHLDPGENAPILVQIDQYLSDLMAYRDDAHLAAWQPLGLDGPTWETLSLLWDKRVETLDELNEKLRFRGQSGSVYEKALYTLTDKGLAKLYKGTYSITKKGRKLREQAEQLTEEYFFAPWECLSEEDLETLENLLKMLAEGLN